MHVWHGFHLHCVSFWWVTVVCIYLTVITSKPYFIQLKPDLTSVRLEIFSFKWQICEFQLLLIISWMSSVLTLPSRADSSITYWHLSVDPVGFWILLIISTEFISFHYNSPITSSHLAPYPALYPVVRTRADFHFCILHYSRGTVWIFQHRKYKSVSFSAVICNQPSSSHSASNSGQLFRECVYM